MRKLMGVILAFAMTMALFVGCSNASTLKDGKYRAEFKEASHGWKEYVEITVKDGKIAEVDFDAISDDGKKKTDDPTYKDAMVNAGANTWPEAFYPDYEQQLIDKQDVNKVDAIAGATHSADNLKKLVTALTKNMKSGKTETVIVENSAEE